MDDLKYRLQTWLGRRPSQNGRTFHEMHEEVLISEAFERIKRLEGKLRLLRDEIDCTLLNVPVHVETKEEKREKKKGTKIERDWLSSRAWRALQNEEIDTLEELAEYGERRLMRIPNLGNKTLKELKNLLFANGITMSVYGRDS